MQKVEEDKSWLIFDRIFRPTNWLRIRVALAKELWYQTLQKNGNRLYKVFSIDIEEHKEDAELKLYSLTILGLVISIGWF